jgi:L-rhamnose-H+ transport protein
MNAVFTQHPREVGLLLVVLAGAMNAAYVLPTKSTPKWTFENTWLVYSVVAMLGLSWAIAIWTVPALGAVYARAGIGAVGMAFLFGLIWGLANVLFGMGIYWIGMSLTFPICIGLSTALGSLVPMAMQPGSFCTAGGATIALGVGVLLAGVVVCALAGIRKDAQVQAAAALQEADGSPSLPRRLPMGLAIVVLAGFCDPCLNYAFSFGDRIKEEAVAGGAAEVVASDAIWALALSGSFVVNAMYCAVLLTRNGTWSRFRAKGTGHYWFLAALMGVIWMLSITLYGRGASMMGRLGGSVGWAMFYCVIIIGSMLLGIVSREWVEGRGRPLRTLYAAMAVLTAAGVILGYGNSLTAP